ncbi:MAG: glycine cleavage system aminomethyltransferase GcvT [Candidatus Marinimicrobia bacterium]|nr:glycine cleavage system aminomethyltransferase GcvT [Candidatus Neomarinimicrobiota bacterium]
MEIKKSSLYQRHIDLGAKMVEFSGFMMPIQYSGITNEHNAVRTAAGMFDVSHMGEFRISGENAEPFLQFVTINDVTKLSPGQAQYSAMCYDDGGIVDDLLIYRHEEYYVLVVNAANLQKDFQWMENHLIEGVVLEDISNEVNLIALQGPKSREILQKLTNIDLQSLAFYHFTNGEVGNSTVTLARTGYTGELGYEIYGKPQDIPAIWDELLDAGHKDGLIPIGLGARDTLRLEMKYCLYGNDIDATTHPYEAGLGWITKPDKGSFVGRDAIINRKETMSRRLVCFEMTDRAIPRKGYSLYLGDKEVGYVTSGTQSPSLKKGIALGYVNRPFTKSGTEISVDIRGKHKSAVIVKPPFYKDGTVQI